jgi:OmpA-OmpF porin, OOP family
MTKRPVVNSAHASLLRYGFRMMAVVAGLVMAQGVAAQSWVVGASVGSAEQYDYSVGGTIDDSHETDTGFRVFGGYFFHPNFGGVLSFVDLGKPRYAGPAFGGFTDSLSADGVDLSMVAGWAPGAQSIARVFGTVGLFRWQQNVHYVDGSGTYDYHDKGMSVSFGGGVEFGFGKGGAWGMHIAYQLFKDVGENANSGHKYDRSLLDVGVEYRFGN